MSIIITTISKKSSRRRIFSISVLFLENDSCAEERYDQSRSCDHRAASALCRGSFGDLGCFGLRGSLGCGIDSGCFGLGSLGHGLGSRSFGLGRESGLGSLGLFGISESQTVVDALGIGFNLCRRCGGKAYREDLIKSARAASLVTKEEDVADYACVTEGVDTRADKDIVAVDGEDRIISGNLKLCKGSEGALIINANLAGVLSGYKEILAPDSNAVCGFLNCLIDDKRTVGGNRDDSSL